MFAHTHGCYLGATGPLRLVRDLSAALHRDAMRKFFDAPREEREQYAEQAAKYRDLMDRADMARLVCNVGMSAGLSR
jgi:hypothetical protein